LARYKDIETVFMTPRSFVSTVLLALAILSVVEIALDAATHHASPRQQWRARVHHGSLRASQRRDPALVGEAGSSPLRRALGLVAPGDGVHPLLLIPVSIFVPPRV
jgi:hypothetical protein